MKFNDLREFITHLENQNDLKRISVPVNPRLEITEICDRTLRQDGPALLFENPIGSDIPVLANLFGSTRRIVMALGKKDLQDLRELGKYLSAIRHPDPVKGLSDAWQKMPMLKSIFNMKTGTQKNAPCKEVSLIGNEIDLSKLPIQTCWPNDAGPLITWGLVVTSNLDYDRLNVGVYRLQVIGHNKLVLRCLQHRGGALDYKLWQQRYPKKPFPIAVVIGTDPVTLLSAVMPIPNTISEFDFAGLLRNSKTILTHCTTHDLKVPANSEFILEGRIHHGETYDEGPFADHTGYYNTKEHFPVITLDCITHRKNPIYLSTYTTRPPDEPSILGLALNEIFIPLLQKQFPEVQDCFLFPEACSYRLMAVSIKKQYIGHAKQIMFGIWSYLKQFTYTKFIIVVDDDINIRDWEDIIWAMTTRMDPARDTVIIENTPIDYLDFASPVSGLGSKIGFDATNKWPGETSREWGKSVEMDTQTKKRVDDIWKELGIFVS